MQAACDRSTVTVAVLTRQIGDGVVDPHAD
jgi:hypothetical protein